VNQAELLRYVVETLEELREMDMRFWLDQAEAEERAMGATPYTRELP
jgi:hypothetical protein